VSSIGTGFYLLAKSKHSETTLLDLRYWFGHCFSKITEID